MVSALKLPPSGAINKCLLSLSLPSPQEGSHPLIPSVSLAGAFG